jgi:benzoyl-CoA 2,3-dioxygenase component B
MLTEEAHHLFVGKSGVARVIQRTCDVMREFKTDDPAKLRALGVIDLPTIQKYLNFHFSVTSDLYGNEVSSNAATYYNSGLKGRFEETKIADDHLLGTENYTVPDVAADRIFDKQVPALSALNERLRDDWIKDVAAGVERWNRVPAKAGLDFRFKLPHKGFHRKIGVFAGVEVSPEGQVLGEGQWTHQHRHWLPTDEDRAYVHSLMGRVTGVGQYANWIAPPPVGINRQGVDFPYVRFN